MKKSFLMLGFVLFTSCMKEGKKVEVVENLADFEVVKLFEVDGVTVYRFNDGSKTVYFTNRQGEVSHEEKVIVNGKYVKSKKVQVLCE